MSAAPVYRVELPVPPSVNRYWRHAGGRTYRSNKADLWRHTAWALLCEASSLGAMPDAPLEGWVRVATRYHPADGRRMDVDNVNKAVLDALQGAGVFADDAQVTSCTTVLGAADKADPRVVVALTRTVEHPLCDLLDNAEPAL